jgi:hypothetical protein
MCQEKQEIKATKDVSVKINASQRSASVKAVIPNVIVVSPVAISSAHPILISITISMNNHHFYFIYSL